MRNTNSPIIAAIKNITFNCFHLKNFTLIVSNVKNLLTKRFTHKANDVTFVAFMTQNDLFATFRLIYAAFVKQECI